MAPPLGPMFAIVDHVALPVGLDAAPLLAQGRRCLADYLLWVRPRCPQTATRQRSARHLEGVPSRAVVLRRGPPPGKASCREIVARHLISSKRWQTLPMERGAASGRGGGCAGAQARGQEGVEDADGVDTLVVHLLADLGAGREAAAFAASGTAAALPELRPRLTDAGEGAALAHLAATAGHAQEALTLWRARFFPSPSPSFPFRPAHMCTSHGPACLAGALR